MSLNFGSGLFPNRGEINANYDFTELLTQQGFVNFYIGNILDKEGVETNILSANNFKPIDETIADSNLISGGHEQTDVTEFTKEFKTTINAPQTIEGKGLISLYRSYNKSALAQPVVIDTHIEIELIRLRNGVEAEIAKSETPNLGSTSGNEGKSAYETIELDCKKTRLNKGDILMIRIKWIWDLIGSETDYSWDLAYSFSTDANNRLATAVNYGKPTADGSPFVYAKSKQFKVTIPFNINI